jgi:hypothetical protein
VPRYEGTATYRGAGWEVTDRVLFDQESLLPIRRIAGLPGRPLNESDTIALLVDRLGRQGWSATQVGANTVFARARHVRAGARLFPLSTLRHLPVTPPNTITLGEGRQVSFAPGERSQLILTTGAHVVGITAPAGERSATPTGETFRIDLDAPGVGQRVDVQMQLLSPLMRNELGALVGKLTAGELAKWLVVVIAAICADEIKLFARNLLHRLGSRLVRRRPMLTEAAVVAAPVSADPPLSNLGTDESQPAE